MSTTALSSTTASPTAGPRPGAARTIAPIPATRLVVVELRKSFDTRAGVWLLAAIVASAVLATLALITLGNDSDLTYASFASAIGIPMAVLLPVIAALSVTSEWSQRSGLTSFTLVPLRARVIVAKLVATLVVGVASMVVAMVVGALGTVVGSAIAGVDQVWNVTAAELAYIVLANVLGMLVGFMLGVLLRSSPGAIVGYFVYGFVLPPLLFTLAARQEWFADLQPWVDFNHAQGDLFAGTMGGEAWAQLALSGTVWLLLPLAIGLRAVLRSEVK